MAVAGEDAMEMSRFVAACDTLGLASLPSRASPSIRRRAASDSLSSVLTRCGRRYSSRLFARSEAPLLPKPSHRMEYDTELVLSAARSTLLPLQYNLRTATRLGMAASKQQPPQKPAQSTQPIEARLFLIGGRSPPAPQPQRLPPPRGVQHHRYRHRLQWRRWRCPPQRCQRRRRRRRL